MFCLSSSAARLRVAVTCTDCIRDSAGTPKAARCRLPVAGRCRGALCKAKSGARRPTASEHTSATAVVHTTAHHRDSQSRVSGNGDAVADGKESATGSRMRVSASVPRPPSRLRVQRRTAKKKGCVYTEMHCQKERLRVHRGALPTRKAACTQRRTAKKKAAACTQRCTAKKKGRVYTEVHCQSLRCFHAVQRAYQLVK